MALDSNETTPWDGLLLDALIEAVKAIVATVATMMIMTFFMICAFIGFTITSHGSFHLYMHKS